MLSAANFSLILTNIKHSNSTSCLNTSVVHVTLCGISPSRAPCCAANTPQWIIPEASPEVSSLETLVERVRDATSSTEQQTIAAPLYSNYR